MVPAMPGDMALYNAAGFAMFAIEYIACCCCGLGDWDWGVEASDPLPEPVGCCVWIFCMACSFSKVSADKRVTCNGRTS